MNDLETQLCGEKIRTLKCGLPFCFVQIAPPPAAFPT